MCPLGGETLTELEERDGRLQPPSPPRAFAKRKKDHDKHGFSQVCPGCRALLVGTLRQKHSEECRRHMEHEVRLDPCAPREGKWGRAS